MKLLMVGDVHGDLGFLDRAYEFAYTSKVDAVIQLGDLGFCWPTSNGNFFMEALKEHAEVIPFYFVPGNHDNYDAIERLGSIRGTEFQEFYPNFFHVPRGCTWEWEDRKFLACGGAFSIDRGARTEGFSYWPQETINAGDLYEIALIKGHVDIMLSHDAPSSVFIPMQTEYSESKDNREMLQTILEMMQPAVWWHGHHHYKHTSQLPMTDVIGLGCNYDPFHDAVKIWNLK